MVKYDTSKKSYLKNYFIDFEMYTFRENIYIYLTLLCFQNN